MRKRTIHNGMRLVLAALITIMVSSFYLDTLGNFLSLSFEVQAKLYPIGIFIAAAMGGYGVVLSAFGLILPPRPSDSTIQLLPMFFLILAAISLFLYLLTSTLIFPHEPTYERLRPGESITI